MTKPSESIAAIRRRLLDGMTSYMQDQREELVALILTAAAEAGLVTAEDITEQWREW
jgi:hypothetical protein